MEHHRISAAKAARVVALIIVAASAQADVTWSIVGTAPGEPDLVGTFTTPDLPFNCGLGPPEACPLSGTLTIPAGALGGGAAVSFDLGTDPDDVLISITTSPLSPGDQFFVFDMDRADIFCDSQSALILQCQRPFSNTTADFDLVITEQVPSVAIGNGNVVITGQLQVGGQIVGPPEPATLYSIGDTGPAGGVVFYVTDGGLHGLEAAPYDQARAEWGCDGYELPGADGTAIGTGAQNTLDILVGCLDQLIAVRVAESYVLNGFSEWFLPSKDEIVMMYKNIGQGAAAPNTNAGGFASEIYSSSSELGATLVWSMFFQAGIAAQMTKNDSTRVRAVRAF